MAAWKIYLLCCLPVLAGGLGIGALLWGCRGRAAPPEFGQATVVATGRARATFRLFDGQIIELTLEPELLDRLRPGDYGRLTYRGSRLVGWQHTPKTP